MLFHGFGAACTVIALGMFYKLIAADRAEARQRAWRWASGIGIGLCVVFAALGGLAWYAAAASLDNIATEEPFFLSEGISIWPSVAVRAIALVWCVWSLFHAQRMLDNVAQSLDHRATGVTLHPFREEQLPAWRQYCARTDGAARTRRVVGFIIAMVVISGVVGLATGTPVVPARGLMSRAVEKGVLITSVFVYLNLLFHVIDSIQSCRRFIEDLDTTKGRDAGRSEADAIEIVDLLASRVGRLVYLPFTAIFMLIAARNPMFDAWDWPIVLVLVFAFGLGVLIWSYLALLSSARQARSRALEYVQRKLLFAARQIEVPDGESRGTTVPEPVGEENTDGGGKVIASPMLLRAPTRDGTERPGYLRALLERIRSLDGVIYRPWYQSPLLGAILIPLGGSGSIKLLEQLVRGG